MNPPVLSVGSASETSNIACYLHGLVIKTLLKEYEFKTKTFSNWTQVLSRLETVHGLEITKLAVKGKGKGFPYLLPSVGPGADPGVQTVSPEVTQVIHPAVGCYYRRVNTPTDPKNCNILFYGGFMLGWV